MARYLNNQKYQRRYLGNTKLKKRYLDETNVWSGGSVVSYFDGETLLTTEEIDEGSDVLHVPVSSKNLIPYPYSNTNKTSNGITWTVTNDGYITATGTATSDSWFDVISNSKNYFLPSGSYRVTGCPTGGDSTKYGIWVTHGESLAYYTRDWGSGSNFPITSAQSQDTFRVVIGIRQGQTVNNLTFKPMVVDAVRYSGVAYNDFVLYGMNKTGYTHIGWTGYGGTERFETKVATGEPMSLYALFVPNTLVVASGNVTGNHNNCNYSQTAKDTNYIEGSLYAKVSATWSGQTKTENFTLLKKGYYSTATVKLAMIVGDVQKLDNVQYHNNDTVEIAVGQHTLTAYAFSGGSDTQQSIIGIGELKLSNPTQWV